MSVNDEREIAERLGGALRASMPSPAPVGAVLRKGRAIRARRRIAAGLTAAAAVAAVLAGAAAASRATVWGVPVVFRDEGGGRGRPGGG